MANWNCYDSYDVPPTQEYQVYGVYDETDTTSVIPPTCYVGPTYNILYTGVTSYEYNGTTFYSYNLYEIPAFSSYEYDPTPSDLLHNSALSMSSYYDSFSTSVSYSNSVDNSSYVTNNSYTVENDASHIENLNKNDTETNESTTCPSTQVGIRTDITNEDSDNFEPAIESLINTPALTVQADAKKAAEYNALEKDSADSETKFNNDCEEHSSIYEQRKILNSSVEINDGDCVKKRKELLYEECVNLPFITENSTILDWSVEVPDEDLERNEGIKTDDDVDTDEDDDFNEANSFTKDDTDLTYSPADIIYLKEKLYLEALFGPNSLEESLPAVGVLPVIEEESETVDEDDASEWIADDLEGREENISDETGINAKSTVTFNMHESFIRNHTTESREDVFERIRENHPNMTENGSKTVPIFIISEEHLLKREDCTIESNEKSFNDDKKEFIEKKVLSLKKDSIMETSSNEAELFVENNSNGVETGHVINAASKNNLKKRNIESVKDNDEAMLKSDEGVVNRNDVISNRSERNEIINATDHISLESDLQSECYSKANGVKIVENDGQDISRKKKTRRGNLMVSENGGAVYFAVPGRKLNILRL